MNTRELNKIYLLKNYLLSNIRINLNVEIEKKFESILDKLSIKNQRKWKNLW
jgi:hypothetical protein